MATKVLYFKSTIPSGASQFGALQEGASFAAVNIGGWAVQTHAVGDCAPNDGPFNEVAVGSGLWSASQLPDSSVPDDSVGDAYRSELPYYGQFANTDWSFSIVLRSTATNWDGRCKINFRLFRGTDPTGSGATELTSGVVSTAATTANLSTTADRTVTGTWSPGGTITLDGEYLFVKVAIEVTTQGTNAGNARFRVGATTSVTTPDYTPATGPKQFWLKDAVPTGATNHRSLQDGGSAITAATTGTGWTAGTHANTDYCIQNGGSEIASADGQWTTTAQPTAGSLSTTIGDAWRSENALTGTFANGLWGFQFGFRSVTGNYTGRFITRIRVYKSANQDGSSATELTSGALASPATVQSFQTSSDTINTISWAPGTTLTFNNEYLFVQVAIDITTAGGGASLDVLFRVGSATAMLGVFTPNLSTGITVTASLSDAGDTNAATATAPIAASASASDAGDTLAVTATAPIAASGSAADAADTLASSVEVGAVPETNATATLDDAADVGAATVTAPIAATGAADDAADALTAAAGALIAATLSQQDVADALTATAQAAVSAAAAAADSSDVLTADVALRVTLTLAQTDDLDTLSAFAETTGAGSVHAAFQATDALDTVTATLTARVAASVAGADAVDALAASVILPLSVTVSTQDQADALAAGFETVVNVQTTLADALDGLAAQVAAHIAVGLNVVDQADTLATLVTAQTVADYLTDPRYLLTSTQGRFSIAGSGGYVVAAPPISYRVASVAAAYLVR